MKVKKAKKFMCPYLQKKCIVTKCMMWQKKPITKKIYSNYFDDGLVGNMESYEIIGYDEEEGYCKKTK